MYKYVRNFLAKVHRGRGQNFPIFISCRYRAEPATPVADNFLIKMKHTKAALCHGVAPMFVRFSLAFKKN